MMYYMCVADSDPPASSVDLVVECLLPLADAVLGATILPAPMWAAVI